MFIVVVGRCWPSIASAVSGVGCRDEKNSCGGECKRGGGQTLNVGGRDLHVAKIWREM